MQTFHVRISKDYLVFSAAHFITYDGDVCERLHGHNYRVAAEVYGPLDDNHYVVDFVMLRDTLQAILAELDHRVLLPSEHPLIHIKADDEQVEATFNRRRWVFPHSDCLLLPIANTTAELLAGHLGQRLLDELQAKIGTRPPAVRIEVDECYGQSAVCELRDE